MRVKAFDIYTSVYIAMVRFNLALKIQELTVEINVNV